MPNYTQRSKPNCTVFFPHPQLCTVSLVQKSHRQTQHHKFCFRSPTMTPGTKQASDPAKVCSLVQTCGLETGGAAYFTQKTAAGLGKAAACRAEPLRRDKHYPGPTAAAPARPSHSGATRPSLSSPLRLTTASRGAQAKRCPQRPLPRRGKWAERGEHVCPVKRLQAAKMAPTALRRGLGQLGAGRAPRGGEKGGSGRWAAAEPSSHVLLSPSPAQTPTSIQGQQLGHRSFVINAFAVACEGV